MGVSATHRINLSMWILIYSFSDTYYVWATCDDRGEKNRLRNLDLREEGRNLNISGEEEIENSFKSELRSLKRLVAV